MFLDMEVINFHMYEDPNYHLNSFFLCLIMNCARGQIQHMHLTDTALADTATVSLIVNVVHWFFPSFDYRYRLFFTIFAV